MSQSYASKADVSLTLTHDGQRTSGVVCLEFAAMDGTHFLQLPCDLLQQHVFPDNAQLIELHVAEELDGSIASFAHHWRSSIYDYTGVQVHHEVPDMTTSRQPDWPMLLVELHVGYARVASPAHEFIRLAGVNNLFITEACEEYIILRSCLVFPEQVSTFNDYKGWKAEAAVRSNSWKLRGLMAASGIVHTATPRFGVVSEDEPC